MQQTKEKDAKVRVFALAKELNLETKVLLELCKELGYAGIKNQLNVLEPDQVEALKSRAKKGPAKAAPASTSIPSPGSAKPSAPPKLDAKIPTLTAKPKTLPTKPVSPAPVAPPTVVEPPVVEATKPEITRPPVAENPIPAAPAATPAPVAPAATPPAPVVESVPPPVADVPPVATPTVVTPPVATPPPAATVVTATPSAASETVASEPKPATKPKPVPPVAVPTAPVTAKTPAVVTETEPAAPPVAVVPPSPVITPTAVPDVPPTPVAEIPAPPTAPPPAAMMPPTVSGGRVPPLSGGRPANLNAPARPANLNAPRSTQSPRPAPSAPANPMGSSATPAATRPTGNIPHRPAPHGPNPIRSGQPGGNRPAGSGTPAPTAAGHRGPGGMPPRNAQPRNPSGPPAHGPNPGGTASRPQPPRPPGKNQIRLTPEQIDRLRKLEQQRGQQRVNIQDINRLVTGPAGDKELPPTDAPAGRGTGRPAPARPAPGRTDEPSEDDRRSGGGGGGAKKPGEVAGRDARHAKRQQKGRQHSPATDRGSVIVGPGGRVDMIERNFGSRIKKQRGKQHNQRQTSVITGKVDIAVPITVRTLSEAIGMKVGELILKLKQETNALYTINSNVEFDVAELIATEKQIELVAKKQDTAEDIVLREIEERTKAREEHLVPRPPIVTIMGHVDHGKTSLLDKIRQEFGFQSDVVSSETGGITQVLRAWRVEKDGHPITFLDTPGHEAFTKMRARGANVTDIAVIVVSAADGIMPQTQEAVAHAKAADVDIIVAINKCDLPGAQPEKVKGRLYEMELVPEDMGGEVPVIFTSAVTGQGIGELLDNIALRAEFAELKADPDQPATGTCLEAYQSADEGVMATLLVGNGTIHKGDVLLCGSSFGKVRAMYNDLGQPIESAGPSSPVRVTGLNAVPDADDPFYILDDITTAREIAEKRREIRQEADRVKFSPVSLDKLREANAKSKISELKVILKAEARGSVEAIKKELEKLVHEEVRTRVLHAGIGAITESDVTLALTSPSDTLIVGFNVTSDDAALKLAEQRGVNVREYQIIYNLVDDIKAALEGRLKPVEEVVHLGRAVVRETFKISKVGTIAGCYVTSGVIERNAKVRVIREGTVIYPPAEKVASLENLKRFKDDAKEVRDGFECGMKLAGFDDIKVGDVIEAFKIEIRQRTL